jgi:hypothetical protein
MADTAISITSGIGTNIDTRTEATNGNHRQVVVLGDPSTNAGVAPVDATAGLKVDLGADNDVTVTGSVAVTNAGITTIAGAVAGTEMQVDVLTMPTVAVTGTFYQATQPVSLATNTPTLQAGSTTTVTQATGTNLHTVVDSGTITAVTAITNALPAGTNAIGKLSANSGVDIGDVDVTSISAGTNLIGDVDIQPRTTGGWSVGNFTSGDTFTALTATAQVIKGSAGKFGGYYIYNPNATATYVILYDIAAASVTVGTSTPKLVFCIPATAGANLELLAGIPFGTAMSIAATTTGGGNTAPSTALEAIIFYK